MGMLSARASGTTRDADVKPGDRICEADIYRKWSGKEDRALGEESLVEVRARRGYTWNEGAAHGVRWGRGHRERRGWTSRPPVALPSVAAPHLSGPLA